MTGPDLDENDDLGESDLVSSEGISPWPDVTSAMFGVEVAALSHTGKRNTTNQDHHLVLSAARSLKFLMTNLPKGALPQALDEIAYGMLVADGMGQSPVGKVASGLALCKIVELVAETPDWILKINEQKAAKVMQRMARRFLQVDKTLRRYTQKIPNLLGMATTLTAACSLGADLFLGHIGDSRAYLLRKDELYLLTRDHTVAEALSDAGIIDPENVIVHGMRRVLTAALGTSQLNVEPQVRHLRLCSGDQLLLCTDGLTESIDEGSIADILRKTPSANQACRALLKSAEAGDEDATAVLARYDFPQVA